MSNKKSNFRAGGYYIALVLCAAAIGVSSYLYYRGGDEEVRPVAEQVQQESDVPAAVTKPGAVLPTEPEVPQTTAAPTEPPVQIPTEPAAPQQEGSILDYWPVAVAAVWFFGGSALAIWLLLIRPRRRG